MAEFEEKLNQILSSPQAMEQILNLANSLSGSGEKKAAPASQEGPSPSQAPADPSSLLSGLDPALMEKALTLLSVYRRAEDEKTRLLEAMRPFLAPERQARLERAVQIARLSQVIRAALTLFQGDSHV